MKGNKVENIEIEEHEDKVIMKSNEVEQAWVELEISGNFVHTATGPEPSNTFNSMNQHF